MNLALSTVAIILGVLPGIVFWNSYLSGRFSRQVFGASTVSELAWYVVLAVPINAVALAIIRDDPRAFPLRAAVEVLTGTAGQDEEAFERGKLTKPAGSLWHMFRRVWATERKDLSLKDVAAAGGWRDTTTLLRYQQPDEETLREVIEFERPRRRGYTHSHTHTPRR